jgi:sulfofructosephosphate aldolase
MTTNLNGLADAAGCLTMLALDHRESLRTALSAGGRQASEADVLSFKRAAIRELGPSASAVLLDRTAALDASTRALVPPDTAVVLAVDAFDQPPGAPVLASRLDDTVDVGMIRDAGASAVKLLVLWQNGQVHDEVSRSVRLAHRAGVAALVEGIVRVGVDREEAVLAAAGELCSCQPDIYKAEIPGYVPGDVSRVRAAAERLTEVVRRPWVVLSNGVRTQHFVPGLREACAGGATGFMAGRAVFRDAAAAPDPAEALRGVAVPRLRDMVEVTHQSRRLTR